MLARASVRRRPEPELPGGDFGLSVSVLVFVLDECICLCSLRSVGLIEFAFEVPFYQSGVPEELATITRWIPNIIDIHEYLPRNSDKVSSRWIGLQAEWSLFLSLNSKNLFKKIFLSFPTYCCTTGIGKKETCIGIE